MEFIKVRTKNFRNLKDQEIELAPQINVFVGQNGQGKTNFLEALYYISKARSFRTSKNLHLVNSEQTESLVTAEIKNPKWVDRVEIKIGKTEKSISVNNKKVSAPTLNAKYPTVLFSPESLQAIKEGPEERRRLIDEMIVSVDPHYARVLSEYERAYKTKSRVLRDYQDKKISRAQAEDVLKSLQPGFIERAVELTKVRLEALRAIEEDFKRTFSEIVNKKNVDISVDYVISGDRARNFTSENVFDAISRRQTELFSRELGSGLNLVGPHKHEISFLYDGNDSRFYCSQGQQRAIILSFKISQVMYHRKVNDTAPVLLLDDVLSELDLERRNFLVKFLREGELQTLVTTTDIAFCEELRGAQLAEYNVQQGQIAR